MSEEIEGIQFEIEVGGESSVELNPEWVAWLESEPVPDSVEGVDPSLIHGSGSGSGETAIA